VGGTRKSGRRINQRKRVLTSQTGWVKGAERGTKGREGRKGRKAKKMENDLRKREGKGCGRCKTGGEQGEAEAKVRATGGRDFEIREEKQRRPENA